jgi:N-acetyltransferase 10
VAIQVAFEGEISQKQLNEIMKRGSRPSGDLIPWTVSEQFQDDKFGQLNGIRIVRIATHPAA